MDLTRPVIYRGLGLNTAVGTGAGNSRIEGIRLTRARYSAVSVHGYTEKRSADDGLDASDVFIGGRIVSLQGEVFGKNKAQLFDLLDLLRLKLTPTDAFNESPRQYGYLPLTFWQPTLYTAYWPDGEIPREIRCRPSTQPEYDIEWNAIGGRPNDGYVVPFMGRLEAKDPRFYHIDVTEEYISGLASPTTPAPTLLNRGNYPAPLNILIHVLAANSAEGTFTFGFNETNLKVTIPAAAKDRTVRIDSELKVVTLTIDSVETLRMDLHEFIGGSTWPKVPPTPEGDNPNGYTWSSTLNLAVQSRLFFSEAWV